MWLLGQEKLILGHNKTNYGTNMVIFWDRRSWYWVITRQNMGQHEVIFWDRRSWYWVISKWIIRHNKVLFWDRRSPLVVITRRILGLNKVTFGDRRSWFWVLKRWIMGHNYVTFGDGRRWYWVITRWIMGHNNVTFCNRRSWYRVITRWIMGQNEVTFLGYWKVMYIGRWSYGRVWDDNKVFQKIRIDLTTKTWQDNIWCPINIILLCTSNICYLFRQYILSSEIYFILISVICENEIKISMFVGVYF